MCIPIPQLVGKVDIEERRPRYWNEPRRKRLHFVKDRDRQSDEWALAPGSQPRQFPRNEQERWDLRQHEAQGRFQQRQLQFDHMRRVQHQQHQQHQQQQMQQFYRPQVPPQWQGQHPHQQGQLHGQRQMHPIDARAHHERDSDIIYSESGSDGSDSHDDAIRPKMFKIKPKSVKLPKQIKMKSGKKRGGSRHRARSPYASESEDSFKRAYRRAARSKSRGRGSRSRQRSKARFAYDSDDSDDSYVHASRHISSKHRGRR